LYTYNLIYAEKVATKCRAPTVVFFPRRINENHIKLASEACEIELGEIALLSA